MLLPELEAWALNNSLVESFSWISGPLDLNIGLPVVTEVTNLGHAFTTEYMPVYATTPNFVSTTINGFLHVNQQIPENELKGDFTIFQALYTPIGSSTMLLGSYWIENLGVNVGGDHIILQTTNTTYPFPSITESRLKPMALLDTCPGFEISLFQLDEQDCIVSLTSLVRLSQGTIDSVDDIPMDTLLIKVIDGATNDDIDSVINELNQLTVAQPDISVWDYRKEIAPILSASSLMTYFFNFTTAVAMLISFFRFV